MVFLLLLFISLGKMFTYTIYFSKMSHLYLKKVYFSFSETCIYSSQIVSLKALLSLNKREGNFSFRQIKLKVTIIKQSNFYAAKVRRNDLPEKPREWLCRKHIFCNWACFPSFQLFLRAFQIKNKILFWILISIQNMLSTFNINRKGIFWWLDA